jgi:hypothetical protein
MGQNWPAGFELGGVSVPQLVLYYCIVFRIYGAETVKGPQSNKPVC